MALEVDEAGDEFVGWSALAFKNAVSSMPSAGPADAFGIVDERRPVVADRGHHRRPRDTEPPGQRRDRARLLPDGTRALASGSSGEHPALRELGVSARSRCAAGQSSSGQQKRRLDQTSFTRRSERRADRG
jgi:hypothetical protein